MKKEEIMSSLLELPQFIEINKYNMHEGFRINEGWLRVFDMNTYNWIAINDNIIEYKLLHNINRDEGSFVIKNEDIVIFLEKQKLIASKIVNQLTKINEIDDEIIDMLTDLPHLQKCTQANLKDNASLEFLNLNNGRVLIINLERKYIAIDNIHAICYFDEDASKIKVLAFELSLSSEHSIKHNIKYRL